ncbi:MAG TPA: NIPSNAP family protein [Edaphobacter sp.]
MDRRAMLQTMGAAMMMSMAGANAQNAGASTPAVYELRIYHALDGRLDDLLRRFRDHTVALFTRHGLKSVAYWTPTDEPLKGRTLIYILEHPSRGAATANWKSFQEDPEWIKVKKESEANGQLVEKIDSTFMEMTEFSPRI